MSKVFLVYMYLSVFTILILFYIQTLNPRTKTKNIMKKTSFIIGIVDAWTPNILNK